MPDPASPTPRNKAQKDVRGASHPENAAHFPCHDEFGITSQMTISFVGGRRTVFFVPLKSFCPVWEVRIEDRWCSSPQASLTDK